MQIRRGPTLSHRAALALILWAGFYVLAFGVAAGLLYFAYFVFTTPSSGPPLVFGACAVGAVIVAWLILWSSFPRWKKFVPPGPRLVPEEHPRLFDAIRLVARDTRQKPPAEVYLCLDVNAWVVHRGGFLGLFTRRVLAVGLPLLKVLTQSQFRSVLAHEFGHYVGGDTRLGPWVYRTHAAIQRTLDTLEGNDSIWRFPFIAYAKLFTRVSTAVSQRQELAADALAARIAGARACGRALQRIEEASSAFGAYLGEELFPVLNCGFRPPLCEGFARFMAAKDISRAIRLRIRRELEDRKHDPYRTHPPLSERLEAVGRLAPGVEIREDPPALDLLSDLDRMERELLATVTASSKARKMPTVAWDEAGGTAFLPEWKEQSSAARRHLAGITPAAFPDLELTEIGRKFGVGLSDPQKRGAAMNALGTALAVALCNHGWAARMVPGERPAAVREGERVEPFHVFLDLAEGKLTRDAWRAKCEAGGFGAIDLGA